jgi:CheY-like chemotaxis protein
MGQPPKTVLIVDDSTAIRQERREEFTLHGYTVCAEAENGRQAIEQARSHHPCLIILDLSMLVMNGLDSASTAATSGHTDQSIHSVRGCAVNSGHAR